MDEMMEQRSGHERRKVEHKDAGWPFCIIHLVYIFQLTRSYLSRQIFMPFFHPDGHRKHIHQGSIRRIALADSSYPDTRSDMPTHTHSLPKPITKPNNKIPQHHKLLLVLRFGG